VQTGPEYFHGHRGDGLTITGDASKSTVRRAHAQNGTTGRVDWGRKMELAT
jgi:hypothetical protein